jgi:hypothetical protein
MADETEVGTRFQMLPLLLNERPRRFAAVAEAAVIGRGGISRVARASGNSRRAIRLSQAQLQSPTPTDCGRILRSGAERRKGAPADAPLKSDLERSIDVLTRGDLRSPLRWTCKSVRTLAGKLQGMGHAIRRRRVAQVLHEVGYSFQARRTTFERQSHNPGSFIVGTDLDTAAFVVASIRHWWDSTGRVHYPRAGRLRITTAGEVSRQRMEEINLRRDAFHGDRYCNISPRSRKSVSIS